MTNIKIALRWFAALVAAILVYLSIWAAVASVWVNFGGNAVSAYKISLLLSSVAGIFVGSFIVPRHQWKAAFGALAALALFGPTWLFAKAAMAGLSFQFPRYRLHIPGAFHCLPSDPCWNGRTKNKARALKIGTQPASKNNPALCDVDH